MYFLGGISNGYDHLVSIHGDETSGKLTLVAPQSRADELDALLDALHAEIDFEVSEHDC